MIELLIAAGVILLVIVLVMSLFGTSSPHGGTIIRVAVGLIVVGILIWLLFVLLGHGGGLPRLSVD